MIVGSFANSATAQDRSSVAGEFAVGSLLFPDDGLVVEPFVGGAARFHLSPRVSVGPEIAYIQGEQHSHLMVTGNVTFDVVPETSGPMTPFVVIGGGLFQTRESFPNGEVFASTEGAFTAGGGLRARLGRWVFAGAEARFGWELHVRLNGFVGIPLRR